MPPPRVIENPLASQPGQDGEDAGVRIEMAGSVRTDEDDVDGTSAGEEEPRAPGRYKHTYAHERAVTSSCLHSLSKHS